MLFNTKTKPERWTVEDVDSTFRAVELIEAYCVLYHTTFEDLHIRVRGSWNRLDREGTMWGEYPLVDYCHTSFVIRGLDAQVEVTSPAPFSLIIEP